MCLVLEAVAPALSAAGPRTAEPRTSARPVLIFTDGACEDAGVFIGGVIFPPGGRPETFGAMLTEEARLALTSKVGQRQIIGQAEILPILVAKIIWKDYLENNKVICFIDNDSARLALIRGYSPVLASLHMVMKCAGLDAEGRSCSWYARVPTKSNIADEPSRMSKVFIVERFGAQVVTPRMDDGMVWFTDTLRDE
jgi:hypothetical protein